MKLLSRLLSLSLLLTAYQLPLLGQESDQTESSARNKAEEEIGFSVDHMDLSVDPKEDFYQFVLGNWLRNTTIPDDRVGITSFSIAADRNSQKIQKILEEAAVKSLGEPKGSVIQQVGDLYASGMDTKTIDKLGIAPIQPELDKIASVSSKQELLSLMANQNLIGIPSVFGVEVQTDLRKSDSYALYLGSTVTLNKDVYLSPDYAQQRGAYVAHIARMLEMLGVESDTATSEAEMILELETSLAEVMLTPTQRADLDLIYNKKTISQLKSIAPNINWDLYFSEVGLNNLSKIVVTNPQYMETADRLFTETSLDDWKSYLRWRLLTGTSSLLSDNFAQENFNFFGKTMEGAQKRRPRNEEITENVRNSLSHAVGQLFVEQHFPPETKAQAEQMLKNIQAQFKIQLQQNSWMSEQTRQKALDKLSKMKIFVGYPEEWIDYSDVEISRDDYLGNMLRLNQWETKRNLDKLGKPVELELFTGESKVTEINATYDPTFNGVQIPAGILQPPFFDASLDKAVNYCSIGAAIGHEFTHGFDSRGRLFDAQGNRRDWWTPEDSQKFEGKAQQLVKQYGQYEALPRLNVNGELTLGENIADLGGIKLAYLALQDSLTEGERNTKIDGFTPEERCFIAWGQTWKSKYRPEIKRKLVLTDPHSPSEFRVTGPIVNFTEFFTTFDIQPGDSMWVAPEERIVIW